MFGRDKFELPLLIYHFLIIWKWWLYGYELERNWKGIKIISAQMIE
jgi:hypothetical protein